jgi:hypothetical protein
MKRELPHVAQALLPARGAKRRPVEAPRWKLRVAFGDAQAGVPAPHTTGGSEAPPPDHDGFNASVPEGRYDEPAGDDENRVAPQLQWITKRGTTCRNDFS